MKGKRFISVQVGAEEKQLVQNAARADGKTISDFVRPHIFAAARAVLKIRQTDSTMIGRMMAILDGDVPEFSNPQERQAEVLRQLLVLLRDRTHVHATIRGVSE